MEGLLCAACFIEKAVQSFWLSCFFYLSLKFVCVFHSF